MTQVKREPADGGGRPVLEVEDLRKQYGATTALRDVSLALNEREVLALLGDNGAGKSTLIKMLAGVEQPDGGEIRIDGERVRIDSPARARELGVETVFQDLALFDNTGPVGNFFAGRERTRASWLGPFAWVDDGAMRKETDALIERLQVKLPDPKAEIGLLSGGQRQAVACARAIAFGERIVILDEPTSALGARESANVLKLIRDATEEGISVILISHNMEHVMEVADRAVVLRQATIAQDPYGMAKAGVEQALAKLDGKEVDRTVDTGAKLITPDNARDYFEEVRGKLGGTGRGLDG